jgi:hypothetical protein
MMWRKCKPNEFSPDDKTVLWDVSAGTTPERVVLWDKDKRVSVWVIELPEREEFLPSLDDLGITAEMVEAAKEIDDIELMLRRVFELYRNRNTIHLRVDGVKLPLRPKTA